MLERDIRHWFINIMKGYPIKIQPIESHGTGRIPDLFFRTSFIDGWIELKCIDRLSDTITIPWRPGQYPWIRDYVKLGGLAFLFVGFMNFDKISIAVFRNKWILKTYTNTDFHLEPCYIRHMLQATPDGLWQYMFNKNP